jgi:hypothetical protein
MGATIGTSPSGITNRSTANGGDNALRYGNTRGLAARALTQSMEFLDQNKLRELIVTDALLMVIPRTTIEGTLRDPRARWDAIREVIMREILTTAAMVVMMPSIGNVVSKIYDRLPLINPKGMFTGAWINAYVLQQAQNVHAEVLKDMGKALPAGKTLDPALVRDQVVRRLLQAVKTGDEGLMAGIKDTLKHVPDHVQKTLLPDTAGAQQKLEALFSLNNAHPEKGIFPLEQTAIKQATAGQSLRRSRLKLAVEHFDDGAKWMKTVNEVLEANRFGDMLSYPIRGGQRGFARQELMLSLRNYVQHVLDRSLVEVGHEGPITAEALAKSAKIAQNLAGHLHGSKVWVTWLPFLTALMIGRKVPTIINWLSRVLHGGKQYFPGDIALVDDTLKTPWAKKKLLGAKNTQIFSGFVAGGANG